MVPPVARELAAAARHRTGGVTSGPPAPSVLRIITRLNAGGPARHVVWLERGLAERGYRTRLLSGRVQGGEDDLTALAREARLDLVEIPALGREVRVRSDWRAVRDAGREIAAFRPEIVHTHTAKAGLVGRLAAALRRPSAASGVMRPRVVHTYHGHVLSGYFGFAKQGAVRWVERLLGHLTTDAVIVLSPRQRDDIVRTFRVAPARRVFVVPLGLDLTAFERGFSGPSLRAELAVPEGAFVVGIVGRLAPVKDHALFLRAAAVLARRRSAARFVVVGGGPLDAELRSLAAALGIGDRVHFLGLRTDLARVYAGFDAVALTSLQEGTPLSLLEAMAAGRPLVATAVGGVPDLLTQEWTGSVDCRSFHRSPRPRGLLVEGRDPVAVAAALELLIQEPARRRAFIAEGSSYVRRFHGLDRLLDDVEEVYRRVLQAPVSSSA